MDKKKEPEVRRVVKKFKGFVISKSGINTIKVRVEIRKSHPLYGKIMKSHKNYLTDTAGFKGEINIGDEVNIVESRPISKLKKFVLVNKVN